MYSTDASEEALLQRVRAQAEHRGFRSSNILSAIRTTFPALFKFIPNFTRGFSEWQG